MGTYTEIIKIHTDKASYYSGETVWVSVMIKNPHMETIRISCVAEQDNDRFINLTADVSPGITYTFGGYFTMPGKGVTVTAYSYVGGSQDDKKTKDIPLAGLGPEFSQFKIADYSKV